MKILAALALLSAVLPARDQVRYPPRPAENEPVADFAGLLKPEDAAEVRSLCEKVRTEKRAPIRVVTIRSMAEYGAAGWPIERYSMNLFSEWGIGSADWNYGMLLLVSTGDRKARIELGSAWGRQQDEAARRIVETHVLPRFRAGDYSRGILEGVRGLQSVALGLGAPPAPGGGPSVPFLGPQKPGLGCGGGIMWIVIIGVVIMVVSSLLRRTGTSAWGPAVGGGGFGSGLAGGCLGSILGNMLMGGLGHRQHDSWRHRGGGFFGGGGGGWGGGSSGGGFSGGGGATGSW